MQRILFLITAMIVMGSCNQMGGSGDVAEGGIGGSGISTGPITDFGSIFVNDIEWFIDDSEIEFDGEAGSEDDLRIGMVVRVQGEIDKENRTGEASEVFFDDELEGPVESIVVIEAEQTKELTILGQKVWIDADSTRFYDDESADFGFDSIGVDDVVEVSGLLDHLGVIRATHVEREGVVVLGVTEVEFQGLISGFTGGGSSFMIGEVTVTFDPEGNDTDLSDLPGGPANGVLVEVEGVFNAVNQVFAIEIELEDEFDEDDVDDFSITGFVSDFVSVADFFVGGRRVDASGAEFERGTAAMLEDGRRVEGEGDLVDDVLIADEVEFEDNEIKIEAEIAAAEDIDVAGSRLTLLGIEILVNASTDFEDSEGDDESFGLDDLEAGDFIEVEAILNGEGVPVAEEIERDDREEIRLEGPVDSFDGETGEIVILGIEIATAVSTDFEIEDEDVSSEAFFDALEVGDFVEVKDEEGSKTSIDIATEVELEFDLD